MTPEQRLWQTVLLTAVLDATSDRKSLTQAEAEAWLRYGGKQFRKVCHLAGLDPLFIREAYLEGRIDRDLLKSAAKT